MYGMRLLLICLLVGTSFAGLEDILFLDRNNFNKQIEETQYVFVSFCAPYNLVCKGSLQELGAAAAVFAEREDLDVGVGEVDAVRESSLATKYEIVDYPTIKFFVNGKESSVEYAGGWMAQDFLHFIFCQIGQDLKTLPTKKKKDTFLKESFGMSILAFGTPSSAVGKFMAGVARKHSSKYRFGLAAPNLGTPETILILRPDEKFEKAYTGELEADAFLKEVTKHDFKYVDRLGGYNYDKYSERGLPYVWLFHDKDERVAEAAVKAFREVAPNYPELSFVFADGTEYSAEVYALGFDDDENPTQYPVLGIDVGTGTRKFLLPMGTPITAENLKPFFDSYTDGSRKPDIFTEDLPKKLFDEHHVAKIVARNVDNIIMDIGKDVLTMFYAPGCEECEQLFPVLNKLATDLKEVENLVIAMADSSANTFPAQFKFNHWPIMQLVTAETNTVIDCPNRTIATIRAFLEEHAVNQLIVEEAPEDDDDEEEPIDD